MIEPIIRTMAIALLSAPLLAATPTGHRWPDSPHARAEARTALETLESALLTHDSATLVLDDWCARHGLAKQGEKIVAERVMGEDKPATAEQRALLHVDARERIGYRRVRLRCGARILSEADNWYVPTRLTPAMNTTLDNTDISFGRVARPLHFRRHTLSSRILWSPDRQPHGDHLAIPDKLIRQSALLFLPDGEPLSMVVETYTDEVLAFTPPAAPR